MQLNHADLLPPFNSGKSAWWKKRRFGEQWDIMLSSAAVLAPEVPSTAFSLDRMVNAVEKVRERLLRATQALEIAHVSYAVAGGNAVAAWVTTVDEAAVRNTPNVDILLRRVDLEFARQALEGVGFIYRKAGDLDVFLDGPDAKVRDAVHIV